MMNITYGLTEETYILGSNVRTAYGIVAYADAENDDMATIIASVNNITTNKDTLYELVSLCNRLKLSAIHLDDVVEDFLAS